MQSILRQFECSLMSHKDLTDEQSDIIMPIFNEYLSRLEKS